HLCELPSRRAALSLFLHAARVDFRHLSRRHGDRAGVWMMTRLGRRRFMLAVIAVWAVGALLMLLPPIPAIIAGLRFCAGCGMLCQTIATGYVTEIAREGRYVTSFYVGGSMGAFLPGLAWEWGGWPATVARVMAMPGTVGDIGGAG